MMKQNHVTVSMKKHSNTFVYAFLLFLLCGFSMQAQIIDISTAVPTSAIDLGTNGTGQFTSTIVNISKVDEKKDARITNIQLQLAAGVTLDPSSVSLKTTDGVTIPITIEGNSLVTNHVIKPATSVLLSYTVKAGCGVIPTSVGNQFSVFLANTTTVRYNEEVEGVITTSNVDFPKTSQNYEVKYPNLYVYVGSSTNTQHNNNKAVEWKVETTDQIKIENIQGAGTASAFDVEVTWPDADAIENLSFSVNGTPITAIITPGKATFRITQTLVGGQSITIVPKFTPAKYFPAPLQVTYKALVVAADQTCAWQTNASGIVNYTQIKPAPVLTITNNVIQRANFCDQKFIGDFTITNSAPAGASNALLNTYFTITGNNTVESVTIGGQTLIPNAEGRYYIPALDLDGDNTHSDISAQSSYTIRDTIRVIAEPNANLKHNAFISLNFNGTPIEGASLTKSITIGGNMTNTMTINSPSDSNEGDDATYTINYDVYGNNLSTNNNFLDIESSHLVYNGEDKIIAPIQNGRIIGTSPITITSSCTIPQKFDLQVQTVGCAERSTVISATGSTIVACDDSGTGEGGCISFDTTVVDPITPESINTCESFDVHATGSVNHWCNDAQKNCPKITKVIARVYDYNGVLEFTDLQTSILVNGTSIAVSPDNSFAIQKGIAWMSDAPFNCSTTDLNLDNLELQASLMVKGNHALPDMSKVNLRVEFAVVDENGTIYSANAKGSPLTVYDPEPVISSGSNGVFPTSACNSIKFGVRTSLAAPSVMNHPITITHISFSAIEGHYYTTPDKVNMPLEYNPNTIGYWALPNNQNNPYEFFKWAEVTQSYGIKCLTNNQALPLTTAIVSYTDFYESCSESTVKTREIAHKNSAITPTITLSSSIEQGLTRFTSWNLTVKNTGSAAAPFVMLKIKPNENNEVNLLISQIVVNDVVQTGATSKNINGTWYISIPNIAANTGEARVRIRAEANNCQDHGNSIIDVTSAWSCMDLLQEANVETAFNDFSCNNASTTQLQMQNMLAVLESETTYPAQGTTYNLCDNIPIQLDVYNSGRAALTEVGLVFKDNSFPAGTSVVGNVIQTQYDGSNSAVPFGDNFMYAPDPLNYKTYEDFKNSKLSEMVINSDPLILNSPQSPLSTHRSDDDIIQLRFNMRVDCASNGNSPTLIKPLEFKTTAKSNCGAEQQRLFNYYLPIAGLEQVQQIGVTASATPFVTQASVNVSTLTVVMTNNSLTPLANSALTITLPDGVITTTASGAASINGYTLTSLNPDNTDLPGATVIKLTAPAGYTIPAGQSRTFTLQLQETLPCPKLESIASIYGSIETEIANCDGTPCKVEATTPDIEVDLIRIQAPIKVTITGPQIVCETATPMPILTASGADTYVWSTGSTTATTTVTYPTTTYTVTGKTAQGCTGTATHTVTFEKEPATPTLTLEVNGVVVTNGTVDYTDWNTLGEAIIKATPEGGTLEKISGPASGCGVYTYKYTVTNSCGSKSAEISFEVVNCCESECVENDLVVLDGKPGYTLEDLFVLNYYLAHPESLEVLECAYRITITQGEEGVCGATTTYELNGCFLQHADVNKDGVIDIRDKNALDQLILDNKNGN